MPRGERGGETPLVATELSNAAIADRLLSFAALLELAEASPYAARAYRRAAEVLRSTSAPVAELVRSGRVRELPWDRPRDRKPPARLVESGDIAELRSSSPAPSGADRPRSARGPEHAAHARGRGGARRQHRRRASRCRAGGQADVGARHRPGDGGEDPGRARGAAATAPRPSPSGALASSPSRSPPRSAARQRATRGASPSSPSSSPSCTRRGVRLESRGIRAAIGHRRRPRAGAAASGRRDGRRSPGAADGRRAPAVRDRARARHRLGPVRRAARAAAGCPHRERLFRRLGRPWLPPELREHPGPGWRVPWSSSPTCVATSTATPPGRTAGRRSRRWAVRRSREATSTWRSAITRRACGSCRVSPATRCAARQRRSGGERAARPVPRPARHRVRHPGRRIARPRERHPRRARLGADQPPCRPASLRGELTRIVSEAMRSCTRALGHPRAGC